MIVVFVSNYLIVGSGLSAFICFLKKTNVKVLADISNDGIKKIEKSHNFYEYNKIGGNTNIWGGYIDICRLKKLKKKNKKFSLFVDNNIFFKIYKISSHPKFKHVGYICEKRDNKIFRIKKDFYGDQLVDFKLNKITIKKKFLLLKSKNKIICAKKINLCVGNLGLLKILRNSKIINDNDIISFKDGDVKFGLNFNLKKENYYIPMSPFEIIDKLIFEKSAVYNKNLFLKNLIVQIFVNNEKIFRHKVSEILNSKHSSKIRYFLAHHITNLEINGVAIDKFIKNRTRRIIVNCSGIMKEFITGSISQNIIYNSFTNC